MNFFLTGATGFIGRYVLTKLLDNNHKVLCLMRNPAKCEFQSHPNLSIIESDMASVKLNHSLSHHHLIHLAWDNLSDYTSMAHLEKHLMEHYFFLKSLIQQGIDNITISGTCFEYGLYNGALEENTITNPQTPYAIAKDCLRKMLYHLSLQQPFKLKWLRLWYMYGQGQRTSSLISKLQQAINDKDKTFKMTYGEQLRDYLHVEQVAQHIIEVASLPDFTGTLNICSGNPISVAHLVERYLQETNQNIALEKGFYPYQDSEPMAFWGNVDKLAQIGGGGGVNPLSPSKLLPLVKLSPQTTQSFSLISQQYEAAI